MVYRGMYNVLRQTTGGELWVSGYPNLSTVREFGIDAIVSVCKKGTATSVIDAVQDYRQYSIPDGKTVRTDLFLEAAADAMMFFHARRKTLIHCLAGRNRSMTTAAIVLMGYLGVDGDTALQMIRRKRPGAIANDKFEDWLNDITSVEISESLRR